MKLKGFQLCWQFRATDFCRFSWNFYFNLMSLSGQESFLDFRSAANQGTQPVDVILVTLAQLNFKAIMPHFIWLQYVIILKITTVRNIRKGNTEKSKQTKQKGWIETKSKSNGDREHVYMFEFCFEKFGWRGTQRFPEMPLGSLKYLWPYILAEELIFHTMSSVVFQPYLYWHWDVLTWHDIVLSGTQLVDHGDLFCMAGIEKWNFTFLLLFHFRKSWSVFPYMNWKLMEKLFKWQLV